MTINIPRWLEAHSSQPARASLYAVYFELYYKYTDQKAKAKHYLDLCEKHSYATGDSNQIAFALTKKGTYLTYAGQCKAAETVLQEAKNIFRAMGIRRE